MILLLKVKIQLQKIENISKQERRPVRKSRKLHFSKRQNQVSNFNIATAWSRRALNKINNIPKPIFNLIQNSYFTNYQSWLHYRKVSGGTLCFEVLWASHAIPCGCYWLCNNISIRNYGTDVAKWFIIRWYYSFLFSSDLLVLRKELLNALILT